MKKINKVNYEKFMGINYICDDMKKMSKYSMDSFCNRKKVAEWKFSRKKIGRGGEVILPVGI